ncbi:Glutaredoxin-like protein [hydrothermal vent metagenome]|uniref:Glutaredoxin-like protein n=1 Tax=hydrothermal vent metagenome TaxID=652676 RepID=A0A3B1DMP5_9ZZZZ
MQNLVLYYKSTCPYCMKVFQFMDSQNMELPKKDIGTSAELRQELVDIGGKGQVPCLVIDGKAMYESDDIITWLQENQQ